MRIKTLISIPLHGVASLFLGLDLLVFYPLISLLPFGWAYPITRARGRLHYALMKRMRRAVLEDLEESMPELVESGRLEKVARGVFEMQATFFHDSYLLCSGARAKRVMLAYGRMEGSAHLDDSLGLGKGALLATMHFGHYFFAGGMLLWHGYPLCAYAVWPWDLKKVNFFLKLHHWYTFKRSISEHKVHMIWAARHRKGEIQEFLAKGYPFYALLDIPLPDKTDLEEVVFFGRPALFPSRILDLAYATGTPLHVVYLYRDDPRDWRRSTTVITEPLTLSGRKKEDLQQVVSRLEAAIRAHPEHWWGWGYLKRMRPEYIAKAQQARDYTLKSTSSREAASRTQGSATSTGNEGRGRWRSSTNR